MVQNVAVCLVIQTILFSPKTEVCVYVDRVSTLAIYCVCFPKEGEKRKEDLIHKTKTSEKKVQSLKGEKDHQREKKKTPTLAFNSPSLSPPPTDAEISSFQNKVVNLLRPSVTKMPIMCPCPCPLLPSLSTPPRRLPWPLPFPSHRRASAGWRLPHRLQRRH